MAERTFIRFTFLKIDPAWLRREGELRAEDSRARCGFRAAPGPAGAPRDATATTRLAPAAA